MSDVDPVLALFRHALDEAYGVRVERAVLYGSRARGDARLDSDYNVAVFFIDEALDFDQEAERLAEIETDILWKTGLIINSLPFPDGAYLERTGFMQAVRADGRDI